eukprot:jgi/Ulvmu1/1062/UM105_0021.1
MSSTSPLVLRVLVAIAVSCKIVAADYSDSIRFPDVWDPLLQHWDEPFDEAHADALAERATSMFKHSYRSYLDHGFPSDNVTPQTCKPQDVQGGVAITLLDALDTLLVFGMAEDFREAERLTQAVSFDRPERTHVFEVTIRAMGGLLSAHIAAVNNPALIPDYSGTFLSKAEDLATRLLPAFDTPTGIPVSWVNLRTGKPPDGEADTCVACTTTLALEFHMLSVLTGNSTYGELVDAAVGEIFSRRDHATGLVGNSIRTDTGAWDRADSGIGPGLDSYYEYLLKMYLVYGEERYLAMFVDQYVRIQQKATTPRSWNSFQWVLDVSMRDGGALGRFISSLTAFWPGMQASIGQLDAAFPLMHSYARAHLHYGWLPERIHAHLDGYHPSERAYPLRPELLESAFILHSEFGAPRYLRLAEGTLEVLAQHNRCACGFCAVSDVLNKSLEDKMESFFLAETLKYMYLLLRQASEINDFFVFTTEAHLMPVLPTGATSLPGMHGSSPAAAASAGPAPGEAPCSGNGDTTGSLCRDAPADTNGDGAAHRSDAPSAPEAAVDEDDAYYDPPAEPPATAQAGAHAESPPDPAARHLTLSPNGKGGVEAVADVDGEDEDEYYDPPEEPTADAPAGAPARPHAATQGDMLAPSSTRQQPPAQEEEEEDEYYDPPEEQEASTGAGGATQGEAGEAAEEEGDASDSIYDEEEWVDEGIEGCSTVCDLLPEGHLERQAAKGRERFPSLTFDVAQAELLRQRRCTACRAVRARLAAFPAPPDCDVGNALRIDLDGCPKRDVSAKKSTRAKPAAKPAADVDQKADYKRATTLLAALRSAADEVAEDMQIELEQKWQANRPYTCSIRPTPPPPDAADAADSGDPGHVMIAYGMCLVMKRLARDGIGCSLATMVPAAGAPPSLVPLLLPALLPPRVLLVEVWVNRLPPLPEPRCAGADCDAVDQDLFQSMLPVDVTWRFVERDGLWEDIGAAATEAGEEGNAKEIAERLVEKHLVPYASYWLLGHMEYLYAAREFTRVV